MIGIEEAGPVEAGIDFLPILMLVFPLAGRPEDSKVSSIKGSLLIRASLETHLLRRLRSSERSLGFTLEENIFSGEFRVKQKTFYQRGETQPITWT